ncbi:hypothetical protein LTR08_005300 [Meristemomyces frigidus]|nr:hypothetical protein LTR08_005300 [Meristemomyces frigidus]
MPGLHNSAPRNEGADALAMQEIRWPSLFWAMVVFGLNSMTQPAGSVCGAPADVSFMLRSSPIICIIDTFVLFHRLAYYYWSSDTIKAAYARLLRLRYQPEDDGVEDMQTVLAELQKSQPVRIVVFILTLAQMVKLYAFGGVVWTKVMASMYLLSFVVIELLVVWPQAQVLQSMTRREKEMQTSGATSLPYSSIALGVAFMLWFLAVACKDIFGQPHHTLPQWLGIVVSIAGGLISTLGFAFSVYKSEAYHDNVRAALLLVPVLGVPWAYYGLGSRLAGYTLQSLQIQAITAALAVVWVGFALMFSSATTRTVRASGQDKARKMTEQTAAWVFLCLHVLTCLLFYLFSYDPAGTSKPSWTEFLG